MNEPLHLSGPVWVLFLYSIYPQNCEKHIIFLHASGEMITWLNPEVLWVAGMWNHRAVAEVPSPKFTSILVEKLRVIVLGLCSWAYGHVFYVYLGCFNEAKQKCHHRSGRSTPCLSERFTSKEFQTDKNLGCFHKLTRVRGFTSHSPPPWLIVVCTVLASRKLFILAEVPLTRMQTYFLLLFSL